MTNVIVTGGAGFVGRNLLAHLLEKTDWRIFSFDSLNYASNMLITPLDERIKHIPHNLKYPVPDAIKEEIGSVDYFFNLASESHVDRSLANPAPFYENNVMLGQHTLDYARELHKINPMFRFFLISTDEVYGPCKPGEAFKEWDRHMPSNPYAASKSAQETNAITYSKSFGLPVIITNTVNNFAPGQHPEKFVAKCIRMLKAGKRVPVHAECVNGQWRSGSRCWIHARNHADALLFLARNERGWPCLDKFHIAGDEYSNQAVLCMIADLLKVEPLYDLVDWHTARPGHDPVYRLDGSKIKAVGWTPPLSFADSLKQTVEYYK